METWKELNLAVERVLVHGGELSLRGGMGIEELMESWLTMEDPKAKGDDDMIMNNMQVFGCVLARYAYLVYPEDERKVEDIVPDCVSLVITDEPIDRLLWRGLDNAVVNLQLHWKEAVDNPGVSELCWKLLSRFGYFASYSFDDTDESVDDVHAREAVVDGAERVHRLSDVVKMQTVDAFFAMFRFLWFGAKARRVLEEGLLREFPVDLRHHHFEAATDTYYEAAMYDDVHIGAVLQYMHRFSGMYHSISQVAYYHHPCYRRRKAPMSREDLDREDITAVDFVPVLQQLYPELEMFHEDADFGRLPRERWFWMHLPGRVWLVGPGWEVWWDPDPLVLVAVYLKNKSR